MDNGKQDREKELAEKLAESEERLILVTSCAQVMILNWGHQGKQGIAAKDIQKLDPKWGLDIGVCRNGDVVLSVTGIPKKPRIII